MGITRPLAPSSIPVEFWVLNRGLAFPCALSSFVDVLIPNCSRELGFLSFLTYFVHRFTQYKALNSLLCLDCWPLGGFFQSLNLSCHSLTSLSLRFAICKIEVTIIPIP